MRISIHHKMSFTPPAGTAHVVLHLLLTPLSGPTQTVDSWSVDMPGIGNAGRFTDAYGNTAQMVNQSKPEGALVVTVTGVVETTDRHGVLGRVGGEPVPALYKRMTPLTKASPSLFGKFRGSKESRLDVLHGLMARVGETLGTPEQPTPTQSQTQMAADGSQSQSQGRTADDTTKPAASASDHAHAFIGGCRALDIPARYVTGYLAPGGPEDEDGLSGIHAWAEAYDEGLGWIGFDPLLQLCPTDRHVRLAAGLDALSAQAVRVVPVGDGVSTVDVSVEAVE